VGGAVSAVVPVARVPVAARSETTVNNESRMAFILKDYAQTPFYGLI